jgi:hypothetical protein
VINTLIKSVQKFNACTIFAVFSSVASEAGTPVAVVVSVVTSEAATMLTRIA